MSLCLVQVTGGVDDDIGLVEKRGGFGGHTSGGGLQRWARFLHACACISKLAYSYLCLHFTVYFFFFRSDSPTVEASVVLFSLETLIITVSAGAVAALVVGFVTGGDHHHQHHHCY